MPQPSGRLEKKVPRSTHWPKELRSGGADLCTLTACHYGVRESRATYNSTPGVRCYWPNNWTKRTLNWVTSLGPVWKDFILAAYITSPRRVGSGHQSAYCWVKFGSQERISNR